MILATISELECIHWFVYIPTLEHWNEKRCIQDKRVEADAKIAFKTYQQRGQSGVLLLF